MFLLQAISKFIYLSKIPKLRYRLSSLFPPLLVLLLPLYLLSYQSISLPPRLLHQYQHLLQADIYDMTI